MLQHGAVLWTWRLLDEPRLGRVCRAERLADHRVSYLDYEGPVSGDRGSVTRWDWGTYSLIDMTDQHITVRLQGAQGEWQLSLPRSPV